MVTLQPTAHDYVARIHGFAELVRCPNPGLLELEGTNTWVLQAPGADSWVVVDPGPEGYPAHVEAVLRGRRVELVLVTHGHLDHIGALDEMSMKTAAPVRGVSSDQCRDAPPLADNEEFEAAGLRFQVVHTPGHTRDSACLVVSHRGDRIVLTGDSVLGRGSTLLDDDPDALRAYLHSLDRLARLGAAPMLPGHGPAHHDLRPVVAQCQEHRRQRLDAIRRYLRRRGLRARDAEAPAIVDELYIDTPADLRFAAILTVRAQLAYLAAE
jgi:glyoxylase-like metal-dependent hydrolase (beta-lactamase superfamily II)